MADLCLLIASNAASDASIKSLYVASIYKSD